jgi:hypothetical protein
MLSLTEMRTQLFKLADRVIETGEPLIIERHGVRLRLMREDTVVTTSRLSKLKKRDVMIGGALRADESPAQWETPANEFLLQEPRKAHEPHHLNKPKARRATSKVASTSGRGKKA